MTFGERLKLCRLGRNMSQVKLETKSGIHRNSISAYELDKAEPSLFVAYCLADTLDIPLDFLAGRLTEKEEKEVLVRIISKMSVRCNPRLMTWLQSHNVKK